MKLFLLYPFHITSDLDPETVKKKKVILDIIKLISCHLLEGSKEMD